MKYGESIFDLCYLLFAFCVGMILLKKSHLRAGHLMGFSALLLCGGDAFHLIPRVLGYFQDADLTAALGIGKLITSLTMTGFYVLLFAIHRSFFRLTATRGQLLFLWPAALSRIILCLFPQNGWMQNESPFVWSVLRNLPFLALGIFVIALYYKTRGLSNALRRVWLYFSLSFLFYLPVAVGARFLPLLGMLMLPKTVCYVFVLCAFLRTLREKPASEV